MRFKHLKFETQRDNLFVLACELHQFNTHYLPVIYLNDRMDCSRHILFWGRLALHSASIAMYKSSFIYQPRRGLPHYYLQSLPASQLSWAFFECSSQNIFPHCCSPQRNEGTRFLFRVSKVLPKCRGKQRFTRSITQLENIRLGRFHTWQKANV